MIGKMLIIQVLKDEWRREMRRGAEMGEGGRPVMGEIEFAMRKSWEEREG